MESSPPYPQVTLEIPLDTLRLPLLPCLHSGMVAADDVPEDDSPRRCPRLILDTFSRHHGQEDGSDESCSPAVRASAEGWHRGSDPTTDGNDMYSVGHPRVSSGALGSPRVPRVSPWSSCCVGLQGVRDAPGLILGVSGYLRAIRWEERILSHCSGLGTVPVSGGLVPPSGSPVVIR
jgi:hypothetical protein